MELSYGTDRVDDVSLIRCQLRNDRADPRRVRLRSRLDGPTLPPRRGGVPETGWDADGVTVRLAAGERRSLGFAAVAPLVEPPVEIVDDEAIEPLADGIGGGEGSGADGRGSPRFDVDAPDAGTAVRELGPHRPPRDVVVAGEVDVAADANGADGADASGADGDDTDELGVANELHREGGEDGSSRGDAGSDPNEAGIGSNEPSPFEPTLSGSTPPTDSPDVDDWLDGFERRIERGERVTDADLEAATEAVADAGGVDELADLEDHLTNDAVRLRRVSERAASLAERADATDVPVGALETLS